MISKDSAGQLFIDTFLNDRNINREYYARVPEDKFDYHMVNTSQKKSDSPQKSLAHQIYVTRKYIYGIKTGALKFDGIVDKRLGDPKKLTKKELLSEFDETTKELLELLYTADLKKMTVNVPWSKTPVSALTALWGLQSHEVLHTGWNLAVMDHLNIERFPLLKKTWG